MTRHPGCKGVSQLVPVTGGVLWVTGQGDTRFFTAGQNGTFTSPAEDFGTLVQSGGTYTYTAPDQVQTTFNAQGFQTAVTTPDGQSLSYTYDPTSHALTSVQAPDGGATTLSYDGGTGLLSSIKEKGTRLAKTPCLRSKECHTVQCLTASRTWWR